MSRDTMPTTQKKPNRQNGEINRPAMLSVDDTLSQRGNTYGGIEEVARVTGNLRACVNAVYRAKMNPVQKYCFDMILVKLGRIMCGDPSYKDNWHDIAGYATLAERGKQND